MSYDENLFHRMAEEIYRMAEGEVKLNGQDVDLLIQSVSQIAQTMNYDMLTCAALTLAACITSNDGLQPDAQEELAYELMSEAGYEYVHGDDHVLFVKTL